MLRNWSRCRIVAAVSWSCLLAACGGGGGGSGGDSPPPALTGTVALEGVADVLVPARIAAQLQGGPGGAGTPACVLQGGTLPAGMALASDCVLSGTPTETGVFTPRVVLTVAGYSGSLQVDGRLTVLGPELGPPNSPTGTGYVAGTPIEPFDVVGVFYTLPFGAREGDVITYRVTSGTLPAGLALDPATGKVSGTAAQAGAQTFSVGATLARNGGSFELAPREVGVDILPAPAT